MLKRAPLYEIRRGGRAQMVDFGGWDMPLQYSGLIGEHAVRNAAGLFDVSHMGEIEVRGLEAATLVDCVTAKRPGPHRSCRRCRRGWIRDLYSPAFAGAASNAILPAGATDTNYKRLE